MDQATIGKLVLVEWVDIVTDHGWKDATDFSHPVGCESVGWLLQRTPDFVHLAADVGKNGTVEYNRRITIPAATIRSIKEL